MFSCSAPHEYCEYASVRLIPLGAAGSGFPSAASNASDTADMVSSGYFATSLHRRTARTPYSGIFAEIASSNSAASPQLDSLAKRNAAFNNCGNGLLICT